MSTVRGTWERGHIVLDDPVDWPDGCRVVVEPASNKTCGIREEDWPMDAQGIAGLLAQMDQIEPFLTPKEEADWKVARQATKEYTIANMDIRIEGLFE